MEFFRRIFGWRMTHAEYLTNLNGLGIFFGAVLGFVMASTETLGTRDYMVVLFMAALMVIAILYVSLSRHRIIYSLQAIAMVAALPFVLRAIVSAEAQLPSQLQPTLAVWLAMALLIEFMPRERLAKR